MPTPDAQQTEKTPTQGGIRPGQRAKNLNPSEAYEEYRQRPDSQNLNRVLTALDSTISKGLQRYAGGEPNLRIRARIEAAKAVKSFKPDKGKAQLTSWVYTHLQRLQRVRGDRSAAVRLPEAIRTRALSLKTMRDELTERLGHEPDLQTLSEQSGFSMPKIKEALGAYREISASGLETEKGDSLATMEERTVDDDPRLDYIYYDQDPVGRKVMEWRMGYGGVKKLSGNEVAKRLGVTPAAVSSRLATVEKQLTDTPSI